MGSIHDMTLSRSIESNMRESLNLSGCSICHLAKKERFIKVKIF
jgi:hypothetical protein